MKKLISLLLIAVLCFASVPATASAAVKINKKNITLGIHKTTTLKITGTTKGIKWTSNNKDVATVTSRGKVKAISVGKATITATVSKKKYTCKVIVKDDYSDWILFETNDYSFVRNGMLKGEIVYYDDDYYYISPEYYDAVIAPQIEDLKSLEEEYSSSIEGYHTLDPNAEYTFVDEDDTSKSDAELDDKISNLLKTGFSSSEDLDTELGKAYLEFCETWISQSELELLGISVVQSISGDNKLYLIPSSGDNYILYGSPTNPVSGAILSSDNVDFQYLEKFECSYGSYDVKQYFFNREDLKNKGIIK